MKLVSNLAVLLSGIGSAQKLINRGIEELQFLTGIGSGAHPSLSGEVAVARMLRRRAAAQEPLTVFDVGANDGAFASMIMQELGDQRALIHCFEPGRLAFQNLERNLGGNPHVYLNHCGLAAERGERELYYFQEGSTLASLTRRRLDHFRRSNEAAVEATSEIVRLTTLDSYFAETGTQYIDLLKIDVEGHELEVLTGARATLRRGAVGMLTFEFGGCNIDSRIFFQDFWYFFAQFHGVEIFRMTPSGYLFRIWKYSESLEVFRAANYLVLFKPAAESRLAQ